ncbi:MAG: M1 family metallopeptidase [Acidobacteriota bacterium]
MLKKLFAVLIFSGFFLILFLYSSEEPLCPQVANYTMYIHLDIEKNLITGNEILAWTNTTSSPAEELWFHLYWNAFQNNRSTFFLEALQEGYEIPRFKKEDWGYCRVKSIKILEKAPFKEADLTSLIYFRQPDDDNQFDQTVFSVKLTRPVQPQETIVLEIEFEAKVPEPVSRSGVYKDYYFIGQWFPKIGVFQGDAWNCHQYHLYSEFFSDYGTYDVRITLPSPFIVGATGELLSSTFNGDGTTTHHFYQHSVHDFAWTASPRFLKFTEMYPLSPGKKVEITLLLQPYHKHLKERYLTAVKNALKYCSRWLGEYPYTTVTCVDPAYNSRSGGMEYPTIFTGGAFFISPQGSQRPEGVTIHEFAHGYFYGLIGSNEFENPWMDEGFTSFLDTEIYYAAYGPPLFTKNYFGFPVVFRNIEIPIEAQGISRHRKTADMDILQRFAWKFMSGKSYSANSYSKAELLLRSLKRFLGEETFNQMLKAYSTRWWFKHPRPEDFYSVVNEFAERDLSDLLDQFVYGSGILDYSVESIRNTTLPTPEGYFNKSFKGQDDTGDKENQNIFHSEVLVRRLGQVKVPVEVEINFDDGTTAREEWDGQYRWKKFSYSGPVKVSSAVVDPESIWVLDINRTNNSLKTDKNRSAPFKWAVKWLLWLQHALETATLLGS